MSENSAIVTLGATPANNSTFTTGGLFATDVTLSCSSDDGTRVQFDRHRCILAHRSSKLRAMLDASPDNSKVIDINDTDSASMQALLHFIYSGGCSVRRDMLQRLLAAAHAYNVVDLKALCEQQLLEHLDVESAVDILLLADRCSAGALRSAAIAFIGDNGQAVQQRENVVSRLVGNVPLLDEVFRAVASKQAIGKPDPPVLPNNNVQADTVGSSSAGPTNPSQTADDSASRKSNRISVSLVGQNGLCLQCKVTLSLNALKLLTVFCDKCDMRVGDHRLTFEGEFVKPGDTISSLGCEDGDQFDIISCRCGC